jgi:hypothetical protein
MRTEMIKKILNEGKDGIAKVGKRFVPPICMVAVSILISSPLFAEPNYPTMARNVTPIHQLVLEPGWRSTCNSNFVLENLGDNPAEIEITMGKDGKITDRISQWNKRGYDLISSLSFAKKLGKTVDIDDVAMIKNMSKDSRVSIHC